MNTEQAVPTAPPAGPVRNAVLRHAAERARLAPSIYNTQPWRLVLAGDSLEIHADESRHLHVLDTRRRQLTVSCGCALFNARVAVAASGYQPIVDRLPEEDAPNLLARVRLGERRALDIAKLDGEIERRRTNRRAFMGEEPPTALLRALAESARAEGVRLVPVVDPVQRSALAALSARADATQRSDPDFVAELRTWTTTDPRRPDGVQAMTVPYIQIWHDQPNRGGQIRSYDTMRAGWLPSTKGSGADECRVLLCSSDDSPLGWLRIGEALERVWLEITRAGYWASPLNQIVEVRATHEALRAALALDTEPQILLRIGQAPDVAGTPRRPAADVIVDTSTLEERS